ncbi:MAG: hypothetical protein JW776_08335 [Candidatus Lokiarchaeota archaeon]|nr:hypothetical protein [Candidatus Lokiarchaeota archaeon]
MGALEVIKILGLKKAGIGCLAAIPLKSPNVISKTKASKQIITVDGCPLSCSKKLIEQAGFKPVPINVVGDLSIKKFSLAKDIPTNSSKLIFEYITPTQIDMVKHLIVEAVLKSDKSKT